VVIIVVMEDPVFKIGDFAQLGRVSTKMLRHYNEIGLLKPAFIDPSNDYRYYTADQLPRLNRIIVLKELGFTLQQIGALLDDALPVELLQDMLRSKQAEVEQQIATEQQRLAQIAARLAQIAQEGRQPRYEVLVRAVEPIRVAAATTYVGSETDLPVLLEVVEQYLAHHRIAAAGSPIVLYHACDEAEVELELAIPVDRILPASTGVCVELLPEVEQAACLVFAGTDQEVGAGYAALAHWMEAGGYEIARPSREVYLQGGLVQASSPRHSEQPYVIEIQFQIAPLR
jgi:DNA-binding transcriptional MerR regulator/effector-binding domain-containing protein